MNKTGDHENYHARIINNNISNFTDHLINKDCLFVNADCSAIAVRIRTKEEHSMCPANTTNILMFSRRVSTNEFDAPETEEEIKDDINDYGTQSTSGTGEFHWHKGVKPHYG